MNLVARNEATKRRPGSLPPARHPLALLVLGIVLGLALAGSLGAMPGPAQGIELCIATNEATA